jgi:FKBP-type peptidyl-prolyl cis-trans isomerase 2
MPRAKSGDTVRIHYTSRLEDGKLVDSSTSREPVEFTLGAGEVIPGLEKAVTGMAPGESRSAEIPVDQAYGPHRDEMVAVIEREQLPPGLEPVVGQRLAVQHPEGREFRVTVTEVSDTRVTIDANHELAGHAIVFDLKLVEVL